jgi:hypothetical protein
MSFFLCIFDINSSLNRFDMRLRKIVIITLLMCVYADIYAQNGVYKDTIYLKNNIKIPCKILEMSYSEITIQFGDNSVTKINTDNIDHYQFADFKEFKKNKRAKFSQFSNNTVFFEGFGNGLYSSINYDRIFYRNNSMAASFRIGYSQYKTGALLPFELNFLGKSKSTPFYSEFGIGYTSLLWADYEMSTIFFRIGFRYQQPKGGLFFRVAFLPLYQLNNNSPQRLGIMRGGTGYYENLNFTGNSDDNFMPWFGVSIGYTIPK